MSAGLRYRASGLHRLLLGREYRDLWTTPINVQILNLQTFGGGLTPTTAGGGRQTKSLRFRGSDRLEYGFRSIDKDPSILAAELQGTVVERIVQDQISSAHPAGPALAAPLMEAAGILHTHPRLVVLPDDPALGQFRERFAHALGFIEARAITGADLIPFAGASEIIDGDEIFARVGRSPADRVDARAFLAARLLDLLIGDWDRHRGQWGWARFAEEPIRHWVPVPEDRDQAFVRYDGLLLALGRLTNPEIVNFGDDYSDIFGLTWVAQEVDRYFLVDLEKPAWGSVAAALQERLTDSVIDAAVAAMPAEYRPIDGARTARALKRRRDKLSEAADRFYRLLASEPDIHATDQAESVTVERHSDGAVDVMLAGASDHVPYLRRRFDPRETSEIRLYLHGGDDRVVVRGAGRGMTLRIIGGPGRDEVSDSSRAGGVRFYTADGDRVSGPTRIKVDRRPYPESKTQAPTRDWGHRWQAVGWAGFGPDLGLFIGAGAYRMRFGFRHDPYASRVRLRAGFATGATTFRTSLLAHFRRANSRLHARLEAMASGIEILRFHGFGNEIVLAGPNVPNDDEFFRVNQTQFTLDPTLVLPLGSRGELALGPTVKYSHTREQPNRFLATLPALYGVGDFGQVGGRAHLRIDTRDNAAAATRGVVITVSGSVYPGVWDVTSAFGEVHGEAATYLSATRAPLRPALALRVGGKKVWGNFPFQEAAFIGDAKTVRLGRQNRFAGDAAVYGNAELRLDLAPIFLGVPCRFGIFGLGDIGRVYLAGESSDRWHPAVGGGIWLFILSPEHTLSAAVTRSEVGTAFPQRTGVYVKAGFAY